MGFYALTGLINGVITTVIGGLVYSVNRKQSVNKFFALVCLNVAIWSYIYYFWQIFSTESSAIFWSRLLGAGAIFISICFFHFTLVLIDKIKRYQKFLIFGYLIFFIFLLLTPTHLFITGVEQKLIFKLWPEPGILYHPFLFLWFFYIFFSIFLLFKEISTSSGLRQKQFKYVLAGAIIGFAGGSTNYFLWYNIPVYPFGNFLVSVGMGVIAWAIVKHQLFGIKLILTQLLVGTFVAFLLIRFFLSLSALDYILNGFLLITFLFFGHLFTKSILKETEDKKEIEKLGKKLLEREKKITEVQREIAEERTRRLERVYYSSAQKELESENLKRKILELEFELAKKKK